MKAKILIAVALIALTFASCSKDYECICYEGEEQKYRYSVTDQYEKGAKEQCEAKQSTLGTSLRCVIE